MRCISTTVKREICASRVVQRPPKLTKQIGPRVSTNTRRGVELVPRVLAILLTAGLTTSTTSTT